MKNSKAIWTSFPYLSGKFDTQRIQGYFRKPSLGDFQFPMKMYFLFHIRND